MPKAKKKTKGSETNSADDMTILNDRPGRVRKPNTRYFGDDFESNFDTDSATTKTQSIAKVKAQAALKPSKVKKPTKAKEPTG